LIHIAKEVLQILPLSKAVCYDVTFIQWQMHGHPEPNVYGSFSKAKYLWIFLPAYEMHLSQIWHKQIYLV